MRGKVRGEVGRGRRNGEERSGGRWVDLRVKLIAGSAMLDRVKQETVSGMS